VKELQRRLQQLQAEARPILSQEQACRRFCVFVLIYVYSCSNLQKVFLSPQIDAISQENERLKQDQKAREEELLNMKKKLDEEKKKKKKKDDADNVEEPANPRKQILEKQLKRFLASGGTMTIPVCIRAEYMCIRAQVGLCKNLADLYVFVQYLSVFVQLTGL